MGLVLIGLLFLIPLILIGVIVLVSIRKSKENFEIKIRSIYCYLILLSLLIGLIISIIYIITSLTEILLPNEGVQNIYKYFRQLITSIGSILVILPLSFYFKKKIRIK